MGRPVIGIPTQTLHAIEGIPARLPASWVMNQRYFLSVTAAGAVPWMVPLLHEDRETLREIYDRLDGVMLAGGVDMDPAAYGEPRHPGCGPSDPPRDAVELQLARWALAEGKPLLGLCRGLQVINVVRGGTLVQDIPTELPEAIKHDYLPTAGFPRDFLAHPVRLVPGSELHRAFGRDEILVNSMHHQGIRRLGAELVPTAVAADGLIEAIETNNGGYVIGVQWHPESLEARDPGVSHLFRAFIEAARRFTGA